MMKVTLVKALLLQVAVVAVGIMVLSRPGADGMGVVETITGKSESIITADRLSGDVVGYQRPVPMTTQPLPDLSGVDFVGLARAQYGRCGEYRALALAVGWPAEQWPKISKVMYRESRCNFDSFNPTDPNGGSRGLMQITGLSPRQGRAQDLR